MAIQLRLVDIAGGKVVTTDERTLPITELFDVRGRPTTAPDLAVVGLAGEPGAWITFKLAGFDRTALQ